MEFYVRIVMNQRVRVLWVGLPLRPPPLSTTTKLPIPVVTVHSSI